MAFTSWPFDFEPDGVTPQETTEDQFRHTLAGAAQNGVGGADHLEVSALSDSSAVSLTTGYGSVAGYSCYNDAEAQVSAPSNSASQARLYWVVLRLDRTARQITPAIVEGAASSSPQLPALSRDPDTVFEEPLASFRRAGGGGGITDLVDYRAVINPQGSRAVSSAARPPYPAIGERIYETDTGREMYYHSGTWHTVADPSYPTAWQPLQLRTGYRAGPAGHTPSWRYRDPGTVELRGSVRPPGSDVLPSGTYYARVPTGARPAVWRRAPAACEPRGVATMSVGVAPEGSADFLPGQIVGTHFGTPRWVSLDNITYDI
ncbi:hypothetical protein [Nocardiopsis sp. FR26]|uniref:hypothetical protein n=1 Tax=Nocardiopsis sp. FR26 TaxID=2605987 RepID=UPI001358948F|nr:hypothetical protein [Nocardiopsis sp. FR26]